MNSEPIRSQSACHPAAKISRDQCGNKRFNNQIVLAATEMEFWNGYEVKGV